MGKQMLLTELVKKESPKKEPANKLVKKIPANKLVKKIPANKLVKKEPVEIKKIKTYQNTKLAELERKLVKIKERNNDAIISNKTEIEEIKEQEKKLQQKQLESQKKKHKEHKEQLNKLLHLASIRKQQNNKIIESNSQSIEQISPVYNKNIKGMIAIIHKIRPTRTEKVSISNSKEFLNKYLPYKGTIAERKDIKKERAKIENVINLFNGKNSNIVRYITNKYYYPSPDSIKIEIRRG